VLAKALTEPIGNQGRAGQHHGYISHGSGGTIMTRRRSPWCARTIRSMFFLRR